MYRLLRVGVVRVVLHAQGAWAKRKEWAKKKEETGETSGEASQEVVSAPPQQQIPRADNRELVSIDSNVVFNFSHGRKTGLDNIMQFLRARKVVMSPRVADEVKDRVSQAWMGQYVEERLPQSQLATTVALAINDEFVRRRSPALFTGNERVDLEAYLDACASGAVHVTFDKNFLFRLTVTSGMYKKAMQMIDEGGLVPTLLYAAIPHDDKERVCPAVRNSEVATVFTWVRILEG